MTRPPRGIDPHELAVLHELDEHEIVDAWAESWLPPDERTGP